MAAQHALQVQPVITQAHMALSYLLFGKEIVSSAQGLQQGDPLATALFCLVVQPLLESLQWPLSLWYLDDGTLGDPGAQVVEDLRRVIAAAPFLDLHLNAGKCELLVMGNSDAQSVEEIKSLLPDIKILDRTSTTHLGAPLTAEARSRSLLKKMEEINRLVERLPLRSSHTALFLLRNCLSVPKFVYTLRCAPTQLPSTPGRL